MSQTEVQLIKAAAVVTGDIADQAVTLDKLPHGTSSNDGKFLRANNGADPTFETVNTDLISDTSPQLGGLLDTNGSNIKFADSSGATINRAVFGTGDDLQIFHSSGENFIRGSGSTSPLYIDCCENLNVRHLDTNGANSETMIKAVGDGAVELYHNNTKTFETTAEGATFDTGSSSCVVRLTSNTDAVTVLQGFNSDFNIKAASGGSVITQVNSNEDAIKAIANGAVELYYDNSKKLETTSAGIDVTGRVTADDLTVENTSGNLSAFFTSTNGLGTLEVGGSTGAFIDLKTPASDDFDIRINQDGTLTSKANIQLNVNGNENGLHVTANGAVDLYHNNSKKFETLSDGVNVTGTLKVNGSAFSSGASLANDGNNRIVTATGSGGLNGESTLTYNGSTLTNTGNTSFNRSTTGFTADTGGSIYSANVHVAAGQFTRSGSNGRIVDYYNTAFGGGLVASVQGNHGQGSFNNHSDYRSKENVVAITDGITQLKKLKPSRFNFINDPTKYVHDGFLAHEVTPAVPSAVSGEKDGMKPLTYYEEGDIIPEGKYIGDPKTFSTTEIEIQMLDYSKLTPLLTAALQETLTKVETLETEVAALKAA